MRKSNYEHEFINLLGRFFTEYLPISVNASQNTIASYKCASCIYENFSILLE